MSQRIPDNNEVLGYFKSCSNWGKWGPDDQLGTINYITPAKRKQAASLVREGRSVTCSRPIAHDMSPDVISPPMRHMLSTGEPWAGKKSQLGQIQGASDFIGMAYHGYTTTHIDSLAHMFWDGMMYNGQPAEAVTSRGGATRESVDLLQDGILTRGVLLDVAKLKGVKWLEKGYGVTPDELEAAEKAGGVRVESGDALFLRTGNLRRRHEEGAYNLQKEGYPGYHGACIPWLHERQVALLGSDVPTDCHPSGYSSLFSPVHQVGLVAMGLWLLDNANLEGLAEACERYRRWEFLMMIAPLRVEGGTGSPVNPIATF